jgi:hypothetical protein
MTTSLPTVETPATTTMIAPQRRSLLRFAVACATGLLVLSLIGVSRGRLVQLLTEFNIRLSPMTHLALGVVLPISLVVILVATTAIELLSVRQAVKDAWNAAAIGLALACLTAYAIGVSLPLMQIIERLS